MKSNATTFAGVAGLLAGLACLSWLMNHPESEVAQYLLQSGAWLITQIAPEIHWRVAPMLAVGLCAGVAVFALTFFLFWRGEIWAAGLASRVSSQALNSANQGSVEADMRRLIKKFGRRSG